MHRPAPRDLPACGPTSGPAGGPTFEPAFELRRRVGEWIDDPGQCARSLADFHRPAPLAPSLRNRGLVELLLADCVAREWFFAPSSGAGAAQLEPAGTPSPRALPGPARGVPALSCELPRWGIPTGPISPASSTLPPPAPPIRAWRLRGELSCEPVGAAALAPVLARPSSGRRAAAALTAATLLLAPTLAHAGEPDEAAVLRMARGSQPPALPSESRPAVPEAPPAEVAVQPSPQMSPQASTQAPPQPSSAATGAPQPEEPAAGASLPQTLGYSGSALWTGLVGKPVELTVSGGQALAGVLVAQGRDEIALARDSDGQIVSVPKAEVIGVRLKLSSPVADRITGPPGSGELKDGRGLHIGGGVLLTVGSAAALAGTVMLAIYPSGLFINLPLLVPGLAMVGGGVAMLLAGNKQRDRFRASWGIPSSRLRISPSLAMGRSGGQAGLVLRF